MRQIFTLLLIILANTTIGQIASNEQSDTLNTVIHQLRIYEVPKENRQVFHDRFRDHAYRIMKKYEFTIVAMWESEFNNKIEFIYLLEWPGINAMELAWSKFMADQEWKEIKARTSKMYGNFVNKIEDRTLRTTKYSPGKVLLK